jgi:nucleobase:cation symporter-1, NCS1 family
MSKQEAFEPAAKLPPSHNTGPVIEQHSINYIPRAERHGKLWHQGPFWFAGNFVLPTLVVGFIGPSMGLSAIWCVLAIILGAGFGTFFMAFHANQGPRMGLPQMIQSRAQFGSRGVLLPFTATVFVYVGFMVFDTILAAQGIHLVLPGGNWFWYTLITTAAIVIAVVGHDLLHFIQRWLTYLLIITFAIITILALMKFGAHGHAASATPAGWNGTAFLVQLSLAAGYNISYAVYVSDYSRYLPEDASAKQLIVWTYLGACASAVWLMALGVVLASMIPNADPIGAVRQIGDMLFPGFGVIAVLVSVVALLSIMGVNAYGAMLTSVAAFDGFKQIKPTVGLRIIGLVLVGIATIVIALAIPTNYLGSFNNFVLLMLYFLIPWTSVNLVDFYFVRHGAYAITDIIAANGIYGRWAWRGVLSYVVGFLVMIPFFSMPGFYTGPIAQLLGGADISFIFGLLVSGGLYYTLSHNIDLTTETAAREHSLMILEGGPD